mmetsp:Transcript_151347/g.264410  ORF Transcript_151347/g.264410 Transcript_151347/m.264410 type:complete len:119 (-) Transcript_151347:855-1211(-)
MLLDAHGPPFVAPGALNDRLPWSTSRTAAPPGAHPPNHPTTQPPRLQFQLPRPQSQPSQRSQPSQLPQLARAVSSTPPHAALTSQSADPIPASDSVCLCMPRIQPLSLNPVPVCLPLP